MTETNKNRIFDWVILPAVFLLIPLPFDYLVRSNLALVSQFSYSQLQISGLLVKEILQILNWLLPYIVTGVLALVRYRQIKSFTGWLEHIAPIAIVITIQSGVSALISNFGIKQRVLLASEGVVFFFEEYLLSKISIAHFPKLTLTVRITLFTAIKVCLLLM